MRCSFFSVVDVDFKLTEEAKEIMKRVQKYIDEASSSLSFQIGEALLTFPNASESSNAPTVQKNIPFIKALFTHLP
jgi:hypothetical protein